MIFRNCKLKIANCKLQIEPDGRSGYLNFAFCDLHFSMSRPNSQIHEPGVSRGSVR